MYLRGIWVKFVYEGHCVNVKVTEAKEVKNIYSRNVKLQSPITPVIKDRAMRFGYTIGFLTMRARVV